MKWTCRVSKSRKKCEQHPGRKYMATCVCVCGGEDRRKRERERKWRKLCDVVHWVISFLYVLSVAQEKAEGQALLVGVNDYLVCINMYRYT